MKIKKIFNEGRMFKQEIDDKVEDAIWYELGVLVMLQSKIENNKTDTGTCCYKNEN